jgi:glutaredoxin
MDWNTEKKLKKIKNVSIDRLKEKSLRTSFVYIFTTKTCPHCLEFKKNTLDLLLEKIKGVYPHELCDAGESSYYRSILHSVNVNHVPVILLFKNGMVNVYSPEQFMASL